MISPAAALVLGIAIAGTGILTMLAGLVCVTAMKLFEKHRLARRIAQLHATAMARRAPPAPRKPKAGPQTPENASPHHSASADDCRPGCAPHDSALLTIQAEHETQREVHPMAGNDRRGAYPSPYPQGAVTHPDGGGWAGGDMKHPGQDSKNGGKTGEGYKRNDSVQKGATAGGKNGY